MVLSSWQYTATASVHPVHLMSAAQAPGGSRPLDEAKLLGQIIRPEPEIHLNWQLQYYTHHHHLLLLSPKTDTHFTIPQRVEG